MREVEGHRLRGLLLEEGAVEHVDRGGAVLEVELAVRAAAVVHLVRHLRVLDHVEVAVALHDHAEALVGVALRGELEGVLALLERVEADERGVGHVHERVVHLEVEERLHAAFAHVLEAAVRLQGGDHAAVSVGAHEDAAGRLEDDLAVGRHAGPHALLEEDHVRRVEPEVVVLLEVRHGGGVVRGARHHVERDRRLVAEGEREDLARVEVEERRARDRADRVGALRAVEAEARALPARDEQHAHVPGRELLLAGVDGALQRRALQLVHLRGGRLALLRGGRAAAGDHRLAARQLLEVDRLDLREERLALRRGEFLPELQDVSLPVLLQCRLGLFVCHLDLPWFG